MKKCLLVSSVLLVAIVGSACNSATDVLTSQETVPVNEKAIEAVEVDMMNTEGNKVGTAMLSETPKGVVIHLMAEGLEPGEKAIHFHETGKCEKPDFKTAGAHFNPEHKEHGFENPKGFHAGDLPNLEIPENGIVDFELTVKTVTLKQGEKNSLLDEDGSALVIHAGPDDYKTDPAGNAGDRMVCGVIQH
ncbi:superoxide dismutase family protein [Jeotgalibacillus soli]|uniref:Superoxide dismutase [Cu-Zn] n=1 Tax=Jeotgalibacillus soli TaxID=889306 RepID=A0A0C2VSF4_9BACL|nr:superoxide dismutase family protein [Jeotgalibacillus soli]KIL51857.1 superoxide dismutase [Jeotgalibacillus soli]